MIELLLAEDIAKNNQIKGLPQMGAFLVCRNGHAFCGRNKRKTHPLQAKYGKNEKSIFLHAEIDCLVQAIKAGVSIEGSSIYIARVLKNGQSALAKPCSGCLGALQYFGVSNIRWTE